MKKLSTYSKLGLQQPDEVFDWFKRTITDIPRDWDYFVNWKKVASNTEVFAEEISLLQSILGVNDFDQAFLTLITENPSVVSFIPSLIVRSGGENQFLKMIDSTDNNPLSGLMYDFSDSPVDGTRANRILDFIYRTGLREVLTKSTDFRLYDFLFGIEAGLDSNARKNRSGTAMEKIVHDYLNQIAEMFQLEILEQASVLEIEYRWDKNLGIDDTKRRYDFAVSNGSRVFLIETNGYNTSGSKLKSTAGEYEERKRRIRGKDVDFVWITDGTGWLKSLAALRQAFDNIDYVFNLTMVEAGCFEELVRA
jgi:type II restriction enzyme